MSITSDKIKLRFTTSPYDDITVNGAISAIEVDNNLINLKGLSVSGIVMSGDTLIYTKLNGDVLYTNISSASGITSGYTTLIQFSNHTGDTSIHHTITELDGLYVNITGDTMTGQLNVPTISATTISANTITINGSSLTDIFVHITGDTMTGNLTVPTLSASTKIITPNISPSIDSISAVTITKSDGTTPILTINSTNKRVIIGNAAATGTTALYVGGTTSSDNITTDTGMNFNFVIKAPQTTGTVSAGGSVDTGQHWYQVMYITALGETESSGQGATITTTAGNNTVTVNLPVSSDPRVTGRRIYRSKAASPYWYNDFLVATINNNIDTTYVDTATDASLGSTAGYYSRPNTTNDFIKVDNVKSMMIDAQTTKLGKGAGLALTFGSGDFFGAYAGNKNTTGVYNYFSGYYAGYNNITGSYNTLVGNRAGYSNTGAGNTALGAWTLRDGIYTTYNTAVGYYTLLTTTGSYNTAVGSGAGYNANNVTANATTSGQYQTLLGVNTGQASATQRNYLTCIGFNAVGDESNLMVLGGTGANATRVTIGGTTAYGNLDVWQPTTGIGTVSVAASGTTWTGVDTWFLNTFKVGDTITSEGQTLTIATIASNTSLTTNAVGAAISAKAYTLVGGNRMTVLGNGSVGIGLTAPTDRLSIGIQGAGRDNISWGTAVNLSYYNIGVTRSGYQPYFGFSVKSDPLINNSFVKSTSDVTNMALFQVSNATGDFNVALRDGYNGGLLDAFNPAVYSKFIVKLNQNNGFGTATPTSNLDVAQATTGPGTVSTTGSSTTLIGVKTQFTNTFKVGDTLTVAGETVRTISTITSDTVLDTTVAFSTTPRSAVAYTLTSGIRFSVKGNGNVGIGTTAPVSTLDNAGSEGKKVTTITGNTTLSSAHNIVLVNSTGATTVTLPPASGCTNRVYTIKNINTGVCTMDGNASEKIEEELTQTIIKPNAMKIVTDGIAWWII
jgi:hypothetical protein